MSHGRVLLLTLFASTAAYGNTLGNGFALDDVGVVERSATITGGSVREALEAPWWGDGEVDARLYRPLTQASFAIEWRLSGGSPFLFHALNVLVHGLATLLVASLLLRHVDSRAALVGALVFAVHPVHVEAVANVVGRAELYAAAAFLGAVLLHGAGRGSGAGWRIARLVGVPALYLLALMSKEGAVTLPLVLLLAEVTRGARSPGESGGTPLRARILDDLPLFSLLGAVLVTYLAVRLDVLGSLLGEVAHPAFIGEPGRAPLLTGLSLWPEYLRLLLFPLDLSADYDPAVLVVRRTFDAAVLAGAGVLLVLAATAVRLRRSAPLAAAGVAWVFVTLLPVSHLIVHPAVLIAERTLYLPSVGLAFVVSAGAVVVRAAPWNQRLVAVVGVAALGLLMTRTVLRNPTWYSSYTVMETLSSEHPESVRAMLARAEGLRRVGLHAPAGEVYDLALSVVPYRYGTLVEAAAVHDLLGSSPRAEELTRRAVAVDPSRPGAHRLLAATLLRAGRGRAAHAAATAGLAASPWDGGAWALLSESYLLAGDVPAAIRARTAALAADPDTGSAARLEQLRRLQPAGRPETGRADETTREPGASGAADLVS